MRTITKKFYLMANLGGPLLETLCQAQETNVWPSPATRLEAIQTNIGRVIIKSTAPLGTASAGSGTLAVSYKELKDVSSDHREYGIGIIIAEGGRQAESLIDYDELDSLISAIDYLNRVDWSVSSLPSLDAFYNTRDGFRMAAFSSRRSTNIEIAVRSLRWNLGPLLLSRTEVAQFRSLIVQAKTKLDALRAEK